jgi:hypothetical protein
MTVELSAKDRLRQWAGIIQEFLAANEELIEIARVAVVAVRELEAPESQLKRILSDDFLVHFTPRFEQLRGAWAGALADHKKGVPPTLVEGVDRDVPLSEMLAMEPHLVPVVEMFRSFDIEDEPTLKQLVGLFKLTDLISERGAGRVRDKYLRGLLATLVGGFETFMSSLMLTYLTQFPRGSNINDLGVTYEQIVGLESLADFKTFVSEREVEHVMARSFNAWIEWLAGKDKKLIDPASLINVGRVRDVLLLRNIFLHNNGVPSRRHFELAHDKTRFELGKPIRLTEGDVEDAVQSLNGFAFSVWLSVVGKIKSVDAARSDRITRFQVQLIKANCIEAVRATSHLVPPSTGPASAVNIWLARQALGDSEVEGEVRAWDASMYGEQFVLAKHVLLHELDEGWNLARSLYKSGDIPASALVDWPILKSIRELRGIDALISVSE